MHIVICAVNMHAYFARVLHTVSLLPKQQVAAEPCCKEKQIVIHERFSRGPPGDVGCADENGIHSL